jgi:diguanylate cyclase (GGDEF)-like protein/PAS domain S-box-containing protein
VIRPSGGSVKLAFSLNRKDRPLCSASLADEGEDARLAALRAYGVLDSTPELAFDNIVQLAAELCGTPMALVSLVDDRRQWFKARHGVQASETPRELAFCAHAIQKPEPFIVTDARRDPRFADNPLVTGEMGLRFYAGIPLTASTGHRLGTLCVLDTQARPEGLDRKTVRLLEGLSRQVMSELELRRAVRERDEVADTLRETAHVLLEKAESEARAHEAVRTLERRLRRFAEADVVGLVFGKLRAAVTDANDAFLRMIGYDRADLADGQLRWLAITPEEYHAGDIDRLRNAERTGICAPYEKEYIHRDGRRIPVLVAYSIDLESGDTVGIVIDISARKEAERLLRESEEDQRHALDLSPQIPWIAGRDGRVLRLGSRWSEITDLPASEALGHGWTSAVHPDDLPASLTEWERALESGDPIDVRYRVRSRAGEYRWFRARASARKDAAGRPVRWYGLLEDVHLQVLSEQELRDSNERLALAVRATGMGIGDLEIGTGRLRWSPELREVLGVGIDEPASLNRLLDLVAPSDRLLIGEHIDRIAAQPDGSSFKIHFPVRRAFDGEERIVASSGLKVDNRVIMTMRDVTEHERQHERTRWVAEHDQLTGLPNRARFSQDAEAALAQNGARRVGLMLLDLDELKQTNDVLGHAAGDALLKTVGARLVDAAGRFGQVYRLGGDEFAVLVHDCSENDLSALSERVRVELARSWTYSGRLLECRASSGTSLWPDDATTSTDLLKCADLALYAAKTMGGGVTHRFAPDMLADAERRAGELSKARIAVRTGQIEPYYQAKVDLRTSEIVGFEALMRWRTPEGMIQTPGHIAAAFEDAGIAASIGEAMTTRVVEQVAELMRSGAKLPRVSINAAPGDFMSRCYAERLLSKIADAGLPATQFEVEVTETVFLGRSSGLVEAALELLSGHGVSIALDDFGTGYASLSHLQRFPLNVLKIDKSFVEGLPTNESDAEIVRAVISMAVSLGIQTVAEGIETEEQAAFLRAVGCDSAQGFLYGTPMSYEELGVISGARSCLC